MLENFLKKKAATNKLTIKFAKKFEFNEYLPYDDTPYIDFVDENKNIVTYPLLAHKTLHKFIEVVNKNDSILDIGCGKYQLHSNIMRINGLSPQTNDFFHDCSYQGFFTDFKFKRKFDAIWCSHVLEHVLDVQNFLIKVCSSIKDNGILAVVVPPLKHEIVGGHVNLFNVGLLFYRLILSGLDCRDAMFERYGYNIGIIVKIKRINKLPRLNYDNGDIEMLSDYFPFPVYLGFNGDI